MADQQETIILNLQVDQGAAERQLEKIEGILLDNKKAVQELQAAYKKGTITQEEYVKENIRLQQNIKKEQEQKKVLIKTIETESNSRNALKKQIADLTKQYDNLNTKTAEGARRSEQLKKQLAGLHDQLAKTNPKPLANSLSDATKNLNIAGFSVGDVTSKLAAFANPATAAVGILGALGTAYAKSAIGAKDLEFAQNQVSAAFTLGSNALAEFISSAEDGEGIISQFVDGLILKFGGAGASAVTKLSASLVEQLEDLIRLEIEVRANASQRLEENQELLEKIADDQVKVNEKIIAANTVEENLLINKRNVLSVLNDQLKVLETQLLLNKEDEALQTAVAQQKAKIRQESAAFEKQLTRINKQQDDLNNKVAEESALRLKILEIDIKEANNPNKPDALTPEGFDFAGGIDDAALASTEKTATQGLELAQKTEAQKRAEYIRTGQIYAEVNREQLDNDRAAAQAKLAIASSIANGLAGIAEDASDAQRALALIGIGIDTASALTSGIAASQDIPYPGNLVAMATTIATVLANIAQAKTYIEGFAEGGYTGDGGKYEPKGVVHGGEFVIPKATVSHYGKEHFNKYLPQYADGGFVANQSTAPINQALIMANALKNLPRPIVDVREVTTKQRNIEVRENVSTLAR